MLSDCEVINTLEDKGNTLKYNVDKRYETGYENKPGFSTSQIGVLCNLNGIEITKIIFM